MVESYEPAIVGELDAALRKAWSFALAYKPALLIDEHPLPIMAKSCGLQGPLLDGNAAATFDGVDKEVRNGNHE